MVWVIKCKMTLLKWYDKKWSFFCQSMFSFNWNVLLVTKPHGVPDGFIQMH